MSKSLKYFYLVSALCFGVDFGYTSTFKRLPRLISKCISVVVSIINIVVLIIDIKNKPECTEKPGFDEILFITYILWFPTICAQLIANLIVLFTSKYHFYNFQVDIEKQCCQFGGINIGIVALPSLFGFFIIKSLPAANLCSVFEIFLNTIYQIPTLALDAIAFEVFLIYYYVYRFSNFLKDSFETDDSENSLKRVQHSYINLANRLDKIKPQINKLITIQLLFDVPKLLFILWTFVLLVKLDTPWYLIFSEFFYAAHIIIQLVLPALMVEMAKSQISSLKRLLHEQMLKEQDGICPMCEGTVESKACSLLRYLEARPLDEKLWSVVPTDLRLPVTLFSLCTTYFVVVVQLTHLDD